MYDVWADPRACALTPQESNACLSLVCVGLCWEVVFADALTRISSHTREIHTTCLDPRSMDLGIAQLGYQHDCRGGEGWGEQLANSTLILVKPVGTKRPPENPKPSALKRRNAETSIFVSTPPVQMLSKNGLAGPKRWLFGVYGFRVKP